jgi:hypothetical protein
MWEHHNFDPETYRDNPPEQPPPLPSAENLNADSLPQQPPAPDPWVALGKFLIASNPFYLISALLIFYGAFLAFGPNAMSESTESNSRWWLLGLLAGYTALLAITSFIIVRLGKVWDDARSIILILLLLLMASSVCFDEIGTRVVQSGRSMIPTMLFALACAAVISMTLTKGLGIKLRVLYQMPYYLIISLFFLHPLGAMWLQGNGFANNSEVLAWYILAFPVVQGMAFLALLPAIRRGAGYVRENGTPWNWPGFPLTIFGMLAMGVLVRQYLLSFGFMPADDMESAFGFYSLIPFLTCISILAIEYACVRKSRFSRIGAMLLPGAMLIISLMGGDGSDTYRQVLWQVAGAIGSPIIITVVLTISLYLYAWWRGLCGWEIGIIGSLAILTFTGPKTMSAATLQMPQAIPAFATGLLALYLAVRKPSSWRFTLAAALLLAALALAMNDTWFMTANGAIPIHIAYVIAFCIGATMSDRFAKFLQDVCAVILPIMLLIGGMDISEEVGGYGGWPVALYMLLIAGMSLAGWFFTRNRLYLGMAVLNGAVCAVAVGVLTYRTTRSASDLRGIQPLFWGALSFVAAVGISLAKGGVLKKWYKAATHRHTKAT